MTKSRCDGQLMSLGKKLRDIQIGSHRYNGGEPDEFLIKEIKNTLDNITLSECLEPKTRKLLIHELVNLKQDLKEHEVLLAQDISSRLSHILTKPDFYIDEYSEIMEEHEKHDNSRKRRW